MHQPQAHVRQFPNLAKLEVVEIRVVGNEQTEAVVVEAFSDEKRGVGGEGGQREERREGETTTTTLTSRLT